MEKFPVALIQEPTAFTSNDPMDIYNNILVFIVGDEKTSNSRSEMHIFQVRNRENFYFLFMFCNITSLQYFFLVV